jgi:hypothetical protein
MSTRIDADTDRRLRDIVVVGSTRLLFESHCQHVGDANERLRADASLAAQAPGG